MPRRTAIAVAVALFATPAFAFAQEGGRITKVILYPGSATIERSAQVAPGQGRVELTGLPANFDPRTLRVEADAGIRIGEVAVRDVARTESLGARESQLEAKVQALKDDKAALDVEARTAELVRDYLLSLNAKPEGDKVRPIDPKAIPSVLEAIRRGGSDAYGTLRRVELRKRALDKQIAALERDLARLKTGARDSRTLTVSLAAGNAGAVRASYQVANAGWRPAYRASLDSAQSRVELERQAAVTQRTGEDWSGVSLRLSTGQPRAATLIDPHTWQLAIHQPAAAEAAMMRQGNQMAAAPAAKAARESRRDEVGRPIAEFQTEYATEFEVPGKVTLAADGRQVSVSLTRQWVPVKQKVRVVPRSDTAAMVTADAERPEGVWLPGDVQLYRDGAYIGSTYWQAQAKDRLVLPFGRDDRVQVTVNRVKNRTGSGGFVGTKAERQIADQYTIISRHKSPVELLLLEASPVAVNDRISVDALFEPKPKTDNWEDRRGVVAWERPLAPGETLKFVADYTITYPK
ncbi:MAG: DUF4139 domain-containing protein, partial [Burkholderiales bacterium]